jgi:hypothetical protein
MWRNDCLVVVVNVLLANLLRVSSSLTSGSSSLNIQDIIEKTCSSYYFHSINVDI